MVHCCSYQYLFFPDIAEKWEHAACREVFVCSGISKVKESKASCGICDVRWVAYDIFLKEAGRSPVTKLALKKLLCNVVNKFIMFFIEATMETQELHLEAINPDTVTFLVSPEKKLSRLLFLFCILSAIPASSYTQVPLCFLHLRPDLSISPH